MCFKQVINPELLNAHAHDAKHVLSFETLRKYPAGPKRFIEITDHFTCTSANVVYCITCTLCKKLYLGETGRRLGDRFRKHLPVTWRKTIKTPLHFKLPNHSKQHMAVFGISGPTSRKQRKPQNSRTKNYFSNRHS